MPNLKLSRRAALAAGVSFSFVPRTGVAQAARDDTEGGIGGTGIVGVLTDFGSLIVAGARVQQDAGTLYTDAFGAIAASDLAVGDSLTVEAAGAPGELIARRVHLTHLVIGTVSSIQPRAGLVVNGVNIRTGIVLSDVAIGDRVAISGVWHKSGIIASRVTRTTNAQDLIAGDIDRIGVASRIGPTALRGRGTRFMDRGTFLTGIGLFDNETGILRVSEAGTGRFTGAAGPLQRLRVEGFLSETDSAPGYRVTGLGHSFERTLSLAPYAEGRTLFTGPYTGRFAADRATRLPEDTAARRALMRRLSAE
ncbi:MAG: DUF5666 domain-containing protein [Pseudomonadota bacterium]